MRFYNMVSSRALRHKRHDKRTRRRVTKVLRAFHDVPPVVLCIPHAERERAPLLRLLPFPPLLLLPGGPNPLEIQVVLAHEQDQLPAPLGEALLDGEPERLGEPRDGLRGRLAGGPVSQEERRARSRQRDFHGRRDLKLFEFFRIFYRKFCTRVKKSTKKSSQKKQPLFLLDGTHRTSSLASLPSLSRSAYPVPVRPCLSQVCVDDVDKDMSPQHVFFSVMARSLAHASVFAPIDNAIGLGLDDNHVASPTINTHQQQSHHGHQHSKHAVDNNSSSATIVAESPATRYHKHVVDHVEKVCGPLLIDSPPESDWEVILDQGARLKVWRRPVENSSAYEYALRGKSRAGGHTFIKNAWLDLQARKKWDMSCGGSYSLGFCSNYEGVENVYWETKYPWPIASRDYVYQRSTVLSSSGEAHGVSWVGKSPVKVLHDVSCEVEGAPPPFPDKVRVEGYRASILVRTHEDQLGSSWAIRVFDDPVMFGPSYIVNFVAKKWLPISAAQLEAACEKEALQTGHDPSI